MMIYRNLIIVVFIIISSAKVYAFEGSITMVRQSLYDTTYITFIVKGKLVRIDEKNSKSQIMQSLVINLTDKKITALSPSHKLYTNIQPSNKIIYNSKDFATTKTDGFKYIDGQKCHLWRVRNTSLNMEVSYWVCESDFDFFSEVIQLLSKTDDYSRLCMYFDQIPNAQGYFPMLLVEKTLLRDEKAKIAVQRIDRRKVDNRFFKIPGEYKFLRY